MSRYFYGSSKREVPDRTTSTSQGGFPQHMFGYTTKQDVGNGCATSRSNRHQIGTQASGNCSDFSTCLPVPHFSPDRFTPPINTPHENLHLLARLLRYLTLVTYDSRSCDASAPEHSFKP